MAESSTAAVVGVVVSAVVLAGLVVWGNASAKAKREQMAKDDPTIVPVGLFPALKVGDVVLVDSALAKLPPPFDTFPQVPCQVDMVLQDPAVVSVQTPPGARLPGVPFFSGTIRKEAILKVAPSLPDVHV